jgi:hypothetical protein
LEIWNTNSTQTILSSPDLFNDLHMRAINTSGTVRPNKKVMPSGFGRKLKTEIG